MKRIKVEKNKNYTTISNVFLRDERLSLKAKGFLAMIMSLKDDWDFTIEGFVKITKEGESAIYTAIKELKDFGYCREEKIRDEKKRIVGNEYTFYEEPKTKSVDNQLDCEQIRKEEENRKTQQQMQKISEIESAMAKKYIDDYLNPDSHWKNGVKNWDKIKDLSTGLGRKKYIEDYIKQMKYSDFLKTPYWSAIAERVKIRAKNSCQVCNSTENLNVHHRSYKNHGAELYHMEDLVCLCKKCHTKYHFE